MASIDNRLPTNDFTTFPLNAVVAVDIIIRNQVERDFVGSGITIAPNHVLTAGHNAYTTENSRRLSSISDFIRTTTSANQPSLTSRIIGNPNDPGPNVVEPYFFPKGYDLSGRFEDDIALLRTEDAPVVAANTIGLLAFVKPETAQNLSIVTAGYPSEETTYDNLPLGRSLVLSPGIGAGNIAYTRDNGRFFYGDSIYTEAGQSGSGIWHVLDGDTAPRVLGVHAYGVTKTDSSSGTLLTTDVYDSIIKQIETDSGTANANELPENALVGSDASDNIFGSYRKERILGGSGDDRLFGGGATDRLEGGEGTDQALFSDIFTNYTYSITNPNNKYFTFDHTSGTRANGIDSLKEIEFGVFEFEDANKDKQDDDGNLFYVPLLVDPKNSSKIKDGVEIKPSQDILNNSGSKIGTITVKSPAWTFDGDIDFSLTLTKPSTAFNFAYIIDTSNSMAGAPLALAKNAAKTLTQSLIDKGIAANSSFAIIPFNSTATLTGPIDANAIISAIDSLTANGNSKFVPALNLAQLFFWSRTNNATNIAYFLSDGFGTGANEDLQSIAEVRAFAVGAADIDSLDIIDSDEAEVLNDPADLATKFTGGTFDRSKIARISVKLGDVTIQTIDPDQLTTDAQGDLTYDGSIANLIVGRTANNLVSFNIDFNDGTPTTSLNYRITSGQEEIRTQSADDTRKVITFSVNQTDFTESGSTESAGTSREINGNELANTVTVNSGKNTLQGDRGDDLFILNGGTNIVDGGEGIDTVKLNSTQATIGAITKNGNTIKIGTNITLQNVEFIELNDVRLSTDTQTVIPIISLQNRVISISEGDEGNTLATFVVNLSSPSTQDTVIDYATRSGNAVAGRDFTANIGKLTIAAGQATGTINIGILGNNQAVGDKQLFLDLSTSSGAIFSNSKTKDSARVNIQDDDTAIGISLTADRTDFVEGSPDQPASVVLTVDRFGNLDGIDVIGYQIIPTGNKPVAANDFVSGLTSGQITFASGEYSKTLEIPISPDLEIEGDESFELKLISLTGSAVVPLQNLQFTILDNGVIISNLGRLINGTTGQDTLNGTLGNDTLNGGAGNDYLNGGLGNDYVVGGADNDVLDGSGDSAGLDTFIGGAGDDVYGIYNSNAVTIEEASGGIDTVWTAVDYTLTANVENMFLVGNLTGAGNASSNSISGYGMGSNNIYGLQGNDSLYGEEGNDYLNGGTENDYLDGGMGNDILDGSGDITGLDTFAGGANDDTYGVYNSSTVIIENADEGADTIWTAVNYTLSANVENMYVLGDLIGIGNSSNNLIIGYGMGNNTIYGLAGNDTLYGGEGNDHLNGGNDNDYLDGGNGNDILDGSGDTIGLDTFAGGANDDTYGIYNSSTVIIESADEGIDTVWTAVNYTLSANVENMYVLGDLVGIGNSSNNLIIGYGMGNNTIYGLAGNDTFYGGEGNDYLNGGTDNDYLDGGNGNDILDGSGDTIGLDTFAGGANDDTYGIYNSSTITIENADEGTDTVWTAVNHTLSVNIENMYLVGNVSGRGNSSNNIIYGYGIGDNIIDGGEGIDTLFGGTGNDTFILNKTSLDIIEDFGLGNDKLQVSASAFGGGLVANTALSANQLLVGANAIANNANQRFIYNTTNGELLFDIDGSGSSAAINIGRLSTKPTLETTSFIII